MKGNTIERNNSALAKVHQIVTGILLVVGLILFIIYVSKAVASADDKKYVEGIRSHPIVKSDSVIGSYATVVGSLNYSEAEEITKPRSTNPETNQLHEKESSPTLVAQPGRFGNSREFRAKKFPGSR